MPDPAGCNSWKSFASIAMLAMAYLAPAELATAAAPDRLDRFRQIAATRLSLAEIGVGDATAAAYNEVYALLDEEIVESLASGGVFASLAFLQERLDAFAEAWGAATLRVVPAGRLVVGVFQLGNGGGAGTIRVYGQLRGEAALLTTMTRDGRPAVHPLPPRADGGARFVALWEGEPSGRGTRALRIDLVRQRGDGVGVLWSTADVFPEGLLARAWEVRAGELRVRYELRYPGWAPGCQEQTEAEDVYRLAPDGAAFVRASRRQHNAWHRDLHLAAARLFAALAGGDRASLAGLVPDRELRRRLPETLQPEPACDAPDGADPATVSVAATGERTPWQLVFQRRGGRWRLTAAAPVLQ